MKLRKTILAAGMALAAIAAVAPMAQAEITHNTESITETQVLHYEGTIRFTAGVGVSFECPITVEFHVSAAGVPTVQSYVPQTNNCTGGGPFTGCIIEEHSFNAGAVHVNTEVPDLTATNFTFRNNYVAGSCAGGIVSTHMIFPETTFKPHNIDPQNTHHSMDTLTFSGVAGAVEGTPGGPVYSGLLHITPSEEGTYTLGT